MSLDPNECKAGAENARGASGGHVHGGAPPQF